MVRNKIGILLLILSFMAIGVGFAVMDWQEASAFYGGTRLIIGDKEISAPLEPHVDDKGVYLPYEVVKDYIYKDISLEKEQNRIFINLEKHPPHLEEESLTEFIKENKITINIPARVIEGQPYVPVSQLNKILKVDISYGESTNTVMVDLFDVDTKVGEIIGSGAKIKKMDSYIPFLSTKLNKGDSITIFGEENNRYRVRTQDGSLGFVEKKYVGLLKDVVFDDLKLNEKREAFHLDSSKINLVWEYVGKQSPDLTKENRIESLDVMAPTWFKITDTNGTIINNGDRDYVDEAHKKGYKVWGLVTNSFDPELTSIILNSEALRKKVIGQLVLYGSLYDLDGINVDFENIYYKDKKQLVSFMEELKGYVKKQNLILSIDVTVPSTSEQWSKVYDRHALGEIVDYVAVMTYDEHWGSSPVSGSVASIGWVERGILRSMESIPREKILLGLPFYTRIWKEYEDENGKNKVESKALSMGAARNIIQEKNAEVMWNEQTGQYYAQYHEENGVYKIWLEDPKSIAIKVGLVEKYGLGGTASWRRGFEETEVWFVLQEMIKNGKKYEELVFKE